MFKVREHFALKIIALATSIMIWRYVGVERNPIVPPRQIMAEVRKTGDAPEGLMVHLKSEPIPIKITGPKTEVDALDDNSIKALVDVRTARANGSQLRIARFLKPPTAPNVTIEALRPFVSAEIIQKSRKRLEITASFKNEPPFGKRFSTPNLDPGWADVVGSQESLRQVVKLAVYIDVRGGSVRGDMPIKALDKDGVLIDHVEIEPATTHVELDLVEAPASKTLVISAPLQGRPASAYVVSDVLIEPLQVTVVGKPEQLAPLTHITTAGVPVEGINADMEQEMPLQLPSGVLVKSGKATVRVTVKLREIIRPPSVTKPPAEREPANP